MSGRRQFLTAIAGGSAAVLLARGAHAGIPPPTASPAPSGNALAFAQQMRAYDPKLTDAEISNIAKQIDDNLKSGKQLNPASKRLVNGDEPATVFRVVME